MKLKDSETLFGVSVVHLREYSKKYRMKSALLWLFDIILIFGATAYMFYNDVDYVTYGYVLVSVCVLINFIIYFKLGPEKWEAFNFYKRHANKTIVEKTYQADEQTLYSVLYCTGYKRVKQNKSFSEYKELMLSACCENIKYSSSIMRHLQKYESENGNLKCYIIVKGKRQFLIDFKSEAAEPITEEDSYEHHHAGAVEEPEVGGED